MLQTFDTPRNSGGFFKHFARLFTGLLFFTVLLFSCSEPDEIGLDLIDQRASFSTTDTLSIAVFSSLSHKVITNYSNQNILGVINDPVFGKARSGVYAEFRLPRNEFSFGEDVELDSIVLSFAYSGAYYGQLEAFQRIQVFELSENIPENDTLYSDQFVPFFPDPVGEKLLRPAPADSVLIDTLLYAPHFTMRLSDDFGQKIIDANGTAAFSDIPSFLDYFKGLYIQADEHIEGMGCIFNLNMSSVFTSLRIYYTENGENARRYDFLISEFARHLSYFENLGFDNADPFLVEQITNPGSVHYGDSLLFVQGLGRVRGNIRFPHLSRLADVPGVIINQARLILPVAYGFSDEHFPEAKTLVLYKLTEDGQVNFIDDHFFGTDYYGGRLIEDKLEYRFNITSHLQRLIDGVEEDHGLVLVVSGSGESAERVVLQGPGYGDNAMRLEIIYTKFD